jgi:hypothetical protein
MMRFPIIEGFDHYLAAGGDGGLNSAWNNYTTFPPAAFVLGLGGDGQACRLGTGGNQSGYQVAFPDANKLTFHFAFKLGTLIETGPQSFVFLTGAGSRQFGLRINIGGHLEVLGEATAVVATSTFAFIPNQVYRCCFQADLTTGNIRCSINGEDDAGLHQNGVDIQDDPASNLCGLFQFHQFGGNDAFIDDLILGIDECVDWGPQEVSTQPVSADVAVQFTPSTGVVNFANVDELPFNADTDYNYSNTVGQKDIFDYANSVHVPESILAVAIMTIARKEESAVRKFREVLRMGATDYNGDEHNLAETYGRTLSVWVMNPATGIPFTAAELNAARGGYELTEVD